MTLLPPCSAGAGVAPNTSAGEADATVAPAVSAGVLARALGFASPIILGRALSGTEARCDTAEGKDATMSDLSSGLPACFVSGLAIDATRAGGGAASAIVTGMVRPDCK